MSTRARSTDPQTSHDAGDAVDFNASQEHVLLLHELHGPMTDQRLCEKHHDFLKQHPETRLYSDARLRSARAELTARGSIRPIAGRFGRGLSRRAQVYEIRPAVSTD